MNRVAFLAQALVAIAVLAGPLAAAQAQPVITVSIRDAPSKLLSANETVLVPLNVQLSASNLVCTSAARMRVTFAAIATTSGNTSANSTVVALPSPAELTFTIPQGAYGSNAGLPAAQPFTQSQAATVGVTARNLTEPANVTVATSADLVPLQTAECRGNGAATITNAKGSFVVAFGATGPIVGEPAPRLPLPPTLVLFALAGALLFMRRRAA